MQYGFSMMHITPRSMWGNRARVRLALPVLGALAWLVPVTGAAAPAQLFIHPTLVMFSGTQRSATVHVVNQGNATGVFELSWVDLQMTTAGGLSPSQGTAPWSLQPFARYSPRRVTLRPGETQLVRIALRSGTEALDGEYYSHLRVVTLEDDLESASGEAEAADSVTIEARTAIAIPVIWRNSDAEPDAVIESARFDTASGALIVELRRAGELSTRGFLHVLGRADPGGASRPLADPMPVVIYPSTERRIVTVPMSVGRGDVAGARVIYTPEMEPGSDGGHYDSYQLGR